MTLLVALKGSDGMVLAADSRGTFGDPRGITAQNDTMQKAHILSRHVAALAAGSGDIGAMVIDLYKKDATTQNLDGATPVMEALRQTVRGNYNNWFPGVPAIQAPALAQTGQAPSRPDLTFLVGGYEGDGTARIFSLISMLDFSPMLHDFGFAVQGVAQYALYLLNRLYAANRTVQELTPLAVYVIDETASQDGKVGGPVNVITIKPGSEGCQVLAQDSVQRIQLANATRSQSLRGSFYQPEEAS